MSQSIDIRPEYLATLKTLLRRYVPRAEVWAYGSRVSGGGHDAGDLDIVLRYPEEPTRSQENLPTLKEVLSESELPILIDVLDWARVPEDFQQEISKDYVIIQYPEAEQ
ncbi:MAG: nucleotidyltransferase domain-containing protein [Candidatus Magnetobacterium sp. LHC-1]|uniref:Nucleotidyltransferase domain-containing protein n=1 Tax=Candidatus Magnetobacterium casense TaxID=1455061 RepID=A0ABS6RX77_9BACT|nr:nucleotidyltransferase domain-containing protein [Candidatus Magnetobacterium casensis]MBF0607580.1 nucleotidyltransferase domain-containing protein [Nitrospirota bacterium]MBV6341232.1 nucleotidyltransferase domain-containing protein [Candidatus Magnetobacterium casensis]